MAAQGGGGKGDHYVSEAGAKLNKGVKHGSPPPNVPLFATIVASVRSAV